MTFLASFKENGLFLKENARNIFQRHFPLANPIFVRWDRFSSVRRDSFRYQFIVPKFLLIIVAGFYHTLLPFRLFE